MRLSGCLPPLSSKVRVFHFHYGCCWTVVAAMMLVLLLEIISGVRRNAHVFHLYPPRGLLLAWLLSPFVQWLLSDSCFFLLFDFLVAVDHDDYIIFARPTRRPPYSPSLSPRRLSSVFSRRARGDNLYKTSSARAQLIASNGNYRNSEKSARSQLDLCVVIFRTRSVFTITTNST